VASLTPPLPASIPLLDDDPPNIDPSPWPPLLDVLAPLDAPDPLELALEPPPLSGVLLPGEEEEEQPAAIAATNAADVNAARTP
jgi:hypothetical protein